MFFSALTWFCLVVLCFRSSILFLCACPWYTALLTSFKWLLLLCSILFYSVCTKQAASGTIRACSWWDHRYYCLQHCPLSSQQQQQQCYRSPGPAGRSSGEWSRACASFAWNVIINKWQRFSALSVAAAGDGSGWVHISTYTAFKLGCVWMLTLEQE